MKRIIKTIFGLFGLDIRRKPQASPKIPATTIPDSDETPPAQKRNIILNELEYNQDGLISIHNHDFMEDEQFKMAYRRGVKACSQDYNWHWRVHVGLWAAFSASKLDGDFVECGVNKGFLSSAIMQYLNWNTFEKRFYLLDTFEGIDERYVTEEDKSKGIMNRNENGMYTTNVESVIENFSEFRNVSIIKGAVPETLSQVESKRIAYLHIDMNNAVPELAAFEYFWDSVVIGGVVLFDDYAYRGYESQKLALDEATKSKSCKILSLPTGQGLIVKTGN